MDASAWLAGKDDPPVAAVYHNTVPPDGAVACMSDIVPDEHKL
jgi:hypothetical protein